MANIKNYYNLEMVHNRYYNSLEMMVMLDEKNILDLEICDLSRKETSNKIQFI